MTVRNTQIAKDNDSMMGAMFAHWDASEKNWEYVIYIVNILHMKHTMHTGH